MQQIQIISFLNDELKNNQVTFIVHKTTVFGIQNEFSNYFIVSDNIHADIVYV